MDLRFLPHGSLVGLVKAEGLVGAQFLPELRGEVERHHSREGDDEAPEKDGRFPDSPLGDSHDRGDEPEKADEEVGVEKEPPDVSVGPYMPQIRVFPSSVS